MLNTLAFGYIGYDLTTGSPVLNASGKPLCLSQFIDVQDPPGQCYLEDFNYLKNTALKNTALKGASQGFKY